MIPSAGEDVLEIIRPQKIWSRSTALSQVTRTSRPRSPAWLKFSPGGLAEQQLERGLFKQKSEMCRTFSSRARKDFDPVSDFKSIS